MNMLSQAEPEKDAQPLPPSGAEATAPHTRAHASLLGKIEELSVALVRLRTILQRSGSDELGTLVEPQMIARLSTVITILEAVDKGEIEGKEALDIALVRLLKIIGSIGEVSGAKKAIGSPEALARVAKALYNIEGSSNDMVFEFSTLKTDEGDALIGLLQKLIALLQERRYFIRKRIAAAEARQP